MTDPLILCGRNVGHLYGYKFLLLGVLSPSQIIYSIIISYNPSFFFYLVTNHVKLFQEDRIFENVQSATSIYIFCFKPDMYNLGIKICPSS